MLRNAKPSGLSERQVRFLEAYRQNPAIAPVARLADVHRATVYRWMADAAFTAAMKTAAEDFFRVHKAKVLEQEAARQRWREARERERRPMRCYYLARARAAKRR
jgi:transposase